MTPGREGQAYVLFTNRVRQDLEREVLGKEFGVFYRESLRSEEALAGFDTPAALIAFLEETERRCATRDAATVALLRAYESSPRDRARVGALVLLALWRDLRQVVRRKTRQLCRSRGFRRSDADDVEQDLVLDLLKRLPRFDPSRASLRTFLSRLADHFAATLIERRQAACRDWRRRHESLQDLVPDGFGGLAPRSSTLDERACRNRRLRTTELDEPTLRELRLDLDALLGALRPDLRGLATRFTAESPTEVSRATGISRGTVYEHMRRIRRHLACTDVAEYVRPGPTSGGRTE